MLKRTNSKKFLKTYSYLFISHNSIQGSFTSKGHLACSSSHQYDKYIWFFRWWPWVWNME